VVRSGSIAHDFGVELVISVLSESGGRASNLDKGVPANVVDLAGSVCEFAAFIAFFSMKFLKFPCQISRVTRRVRDFNKNFSNTETKTIGMSN